MNRTYNRTQANAYNPAQMPNYPIEEQLRARFANRGLGAVSVNAAKSAQMQRMQAPVQRGYAAQTRAMQNHRAPQGRPAQNRPVQNRAVAQRQAKPITESRPPVSQKIPLYEVKTRRTSLPMAALVGLLVCTMMVLSVVWGSAMVGRASDELNGLKNEAAALANTERELSQALDRKNDLRTIERIAVDDLGMIGTDLITKKYISFSGIDVIEAYDDEGEESVGLSTLLSAIGIGAK